MRPLQCRERPPVQEEAPPVKEAEAPPGDKREGYMYHVFNNYSPI